MSWNYRVMRHVGAASQGSAEAWYGLHEVYYRSAEVDDLTVDVSEIGCTALPVSVTGESLQELRWILEKMLKALSKPIFEYGEAFDPDDVFNRTIMVRPLPKMFDPHWGYRVIQNMYSSAGDDRLWYAIHEFYGDADFAGSPGTAAAAASVSADPICPCSNNVDGLRWILERMLASLDLPILESGETVQLASDAASLHQE